MTQVTHMNAHAHAHWYRFLLL